MIRKATSLLAAGALAFSVFSAAAQTATPPTLLDRQLAKLDFGVSGIGQFSRSVSGPVIPTGAPDYPTVVTETASNTLGALINIRYTAKPYLGVEFNYTYARYTENFNVSPGQIQTRAGEYSFGYLVTPPHPIFGLQPFASVGWGTTEFKPTPHGGQGAPTQYRATYYYSVGLQKELGTSHFGVRAAFRQAYFYAPDFLLNYLTIKQHTLATEPYAGFYVRF